MKYYILQNLISYHNTNYRHLHQPFKPNIMKKLVHLFLSFSIAFTLSSAKAQTAPAYFADSLQAILDNSLPTTFTNSGGVMGVVVPGQWSWYGASGKAIAGITAGQPMTTATPTTQFRVGSITKTMVATCILKLEQQGLLSIEDPINMYLRSTLITDTIAASDTVRIRHLLNHTSGIANSADNTSCQMSVLSNPLGSHSLEEAINCGASQGEIFPPGFAWAYSNTNYSILAMIIEKITGLSCADYVRQNIITPLALTHTEIPVTNQIMNPHMGCYWNIGSWIDLTIINPTTYTGWADVVSSTDDLIQFHTALLNGNIINATELAKMKTIDAASYDYGLGLDFYTITGSSYFGHYGEVANTSGMFFADIHSTVAPNGYYIAYNYNTQGVDMQTLMDVPVFQLLNSNATGIATQKVASKIGVFPNPATDNCNIQLTACNEVLELQITDLQGRIQTTTMLPANTTETNLNISDLAKGIYLIHITGNNYNGTQKLIKE